MTDGSQAVLEDGSLPAVSEQLGAADTFDAMLRALRSAAPTASEAEARLWTIDEAVAGEPAGATLVAVVPAEGRPASDEIGARRSLTELVDPTATANVPVVVGSTIVLALALRGRVGGVLTIAWPRPVELGPPETRLYRGLAPHAALLLDNLVMRARQRTLLGEWERERRLMATVLDHVPVGILCIEGPTRRPLLTNRMARIMLAGDPTPVSEPLPLAYMLHPGTDTPVDASELAGVRAALTGERQTCDLDLAPPNYPRFSVETIGVPVKDAAGNVDQVVVVLTDITGRKRAAEEHARLQEAVIAAQAAALVERSTPLIPLSDDVLVMPLIGTIDRDRGEGILEVALQGARERRARVTILDITGVPAIDVAAAEVLTRTARALRLLGVEAVLSGIQPAVAQALIGHGVALAGIVTRGSLQAAIEYAMQRPGRRL